MIGASKPVFNNVGQLLLHLNAEGITDLVEKQKGITLRNVKIEDVDG